ncbi:hypothetical protein FVQ98_14165 [Ottowia sp. GY511]|nr:hypothetical protein FVQ98_14165 [Ottowia sp. GY511]
MPEHMQRRLIMLMCLRCGNVLETLHETELAFHLRISDSELADTKALFMQKGFIDDAWNLLNWDKRQFKSDSSTDRVRAYRNKNKASETLHETEVKRSSNALDTDTDTDTDKEDTSPSAAIVSLPTDRQPPCEYQAVVDLYNETLPELPSARLMTEKRKKAIKSFWTWVLTAKKSDGKPRATNSSEALGWIGEYFARARDNDFLMGRTPPTGQHANWRCDLDFLLTDKGKTQVIEKARAAA